jgi:hypothetical protein
LAIRKNPPYFIQLLNAMDGADLSANARLVLMAQFKFGTHANGRDSRVSEARLLEYLQSFSVRTLQRARKELRDKGWLIERERGHNGKDRDIASMYDIAIPPPSTVQAASQRPKRAPRNPEGYNARKKKSAVTGDGKLPAIQTTNASKFAVTGDHLPGLPITDDTVGSSKYVGGDSRVETPTGLGSPVGNGAESRDRDPGRAGPPGTPQEGSADPWSGKPQPGNEPVWH